MLERIRKEGRFRRIPIIMLSDSTDLEFVNRAYQSGASSYLIRPSSFEALVELVRGLELYWGSFNIGPEEE